MSLYHEGWKSHIVKSMNMNIETVIKLFIKEALEKEKE